MSTIRFTNAGPVGSGTATNAMSGLAKAWVNYATVTSTSANGSFNVASLTDNAAGTTTINFTSSFSATTYNSAQGGGDNATAGCLFISTAASKTTGAYKVISRNDSFAATDNIELNSVHQGTLA